VCRALDYLIDLRWNVEEYLYQRVQGVRNLSASGASRGYDMALIGGSGAVVERDDLQGRARVQSAIRLPWGIGGAWRLS
jgi:hypothetical protein